MFTIQISFAGWISTQCWQLSSTNWRHKLPRPKQHSPELPGVNRRKEIKEVRNSKKTMESRTMRWRGEKTEKESRASPYIPSIHLFLLNINKGAYPDSGKRMAWLAYHKASLCPKLISLCVPSHHEYSWHFYILCKDLLSLIILPLIGGVRVCMNASRLSRDRISSVGDSQL